LKADREGQRRAKNPDEEINEENGREKKTQGEMRTHGLLWQSFVPLKVTL